MYLCRMSDSNMGSGGKECLGWRRVVFTILYGVTKEDLLIESHLSSHEGSEHKKHAPT